LNDPAAPPGVCYGLEAVPADWLGAAVSIGNFDGVHIGHQLLIERCGAHARRLGGVVVAITFEPHPQAILRPSEAPPLLTPQALKLELLRAAGAAGVIVLPVDAAFLATTADEFIRRVLVERLRVRAIVEGPTFGFGRDRTGGIDTLRAAAASGGFAVELVEPARIAVGDEWRGVSSRFIRELLAAGDVETAARALGRPYTLLGRVVRGAGVGRQIGFPTINLDCGGQLVPGDGVYAGVATLDGREHAAAVSIGPRATFGGGHRGVEAFLLDVDGSFYDRPARISLLARLRDQRRFDSPDELSDQIARDVMQTREQVVGFRAAERSAPYARIAERLRRAERPMIVTHMRPDGDAIGSAVGLWRLLSDGGGCPELVLFDDPPERYAWCVEGVPVRVWGRDFGPDRAAACDLHCVVDTSSWQQLEPIAGYLREGRRPRLVIDHHAVRDRVGDVELIDETAPAAALLVHRVATAAGWNLNRAAASALFMGLATDTGWFRFSNTTPEALTAAAALAAAGPPPSELYERLYGSDAAARLRLIGRVLTGMELLAGDRIALLRISRALLAECGANDAMTEEIVNEPNRIGSVIGVVMASESADGVIRLNFRSKRLIDVARLAARFGGGGHARAAGARVSGPLEDVARRAASAMIEALLSSGTDGGAASTPGS